MRFRRFFLTIPLALVAMLHSSCVSLPSSGQRLDSDAVYRAQDDALRPMAR